MNNSSEKGIFRENYTKLFGLQLPHLDTVNTLLQKCDPANLEAVKRKMMQSLLNKKVLYKFRLEGSYVVAVDGTGISSYEYEPWTGCPYKEYKSGKKVWQVPILEAKLVCSNGFALSLGTEWIVNGENYKKQDCEQKAFGRLAETLKKDFPRLPITIVGDGLYPNTSIFNICKNNCWPFIITLKDGSLKTLWEEINFELLISKEPAIEKILLNKPKHKIRQTFRFLTGLQYNKHKLNWLECVETQIQNEKTSRTRFVYLTDIPVSKDTISNVCAHARRRWNIENEGFDIQKHHGYELMHKFSRRSLWARQNYYQCLQIAHIINQLAEKASAFVREISQKETMQSLWECLLAFMMLQEVEKCEVERIVASTCQIRY